MSNLPENPQGQPERHKVHHSYIWFASIQVFFSLIIVAVFSAFAVLAELYATDSPDFTGALIFIILGVLALFILIVGIVFLYQFFSYKHLWYELGTEEFSLYSGIFSKNRVHVPYQRIQSVNQRASFLQRIFGICMISIDTAGGATNKAILVPYLKKSDGERLRSELFARKAYLTNAGSRADAATSAATVPAATQSQSVWAAPDAATAGVPGATIAAAPVPGATTSNVLDAPAEAFSNVQGVFDTATFDMGEPSYQHGLTNKELFFTGLFKNAYFLVVVLVFACSMMGIIAPLADTALGQFFIEEGVDFVLSAFSNSAVWFIVAIVAAVMLIGWVLSIVYTLVYLGGFKASRRDSRIEVEYGLLQHQVHGVDIDRVQSVIIKQGAIYRLLGRCELKLGKIDAMTQQEAQQQQQQNNVNIQQLQQGLLVHPFVKMNEVPGILQGLVPEFADVPTETIKLPKHALRRALIRRALWQGSGFWLAVFVAIVHIPLVVLVNNGVLASDEINLSVFNTIAIACYALCVVLLVFDIIRAVLWFKGSGFGYNKYFMQIANAGLSRESISFPRKKIQFGYLRTNPIQRLAKVATINVRSAAGTVGTTMSLVDVSEEDAVAWMEWLKPLRK